MFQSDYNSSILLGISCISTISVEEKTSQCWEWLYDTTPQWDYIKWVSRKFPITIEGYRCPWKLLERYLWNNIEAHEVEKKSIEGSRQLWKKLCNRVRFLGSQKYRRTMNPPQNKFRQSIKSISLFHILPFSLS